MAKPHLRFTIQAGNQQSVFLSVIESGTGKLQLIIRSGLNKEMEQSDPSRIVGSRYSIHDSDRSPEYTTCHFTQTTADEKFRDTSQLTDAIKKKSGFALLYCAATSDMSLPHYALKPTTKTKNISLGAYDPKRFTFCYAVCVGPPDTPFLISLPWPVQIHQEVFQKYSLVVIWSFASMISAPHASFAHLQTIRPEEAIDQMGTQFFRDLMRGRAATEVVGHFIEQRQHLMNTQHRKTANWLRSEGKLINSDLFVERAVLLTEHFKDPDLNSPAYRSFEAASGFKLLAFEARTGYRDFTNST